MASPTVCNVSKSLPIVLVGNQNIKLGLLVCGLFVVKEEMSKIIICLGSWMVNIFLIIEEHVLDLY